MNLPIPDNLRPVLTFIHPTLMWATLALALYAGYLGVQVKRLRTAKAEERKAIQEEAGSTLKALKDKHFSMGSLLLIGLVMGSIGGMAVTYINNGKLFVGPHLIAGLGVAGLGALSAGLAPLMQQGKEWARVTHISLNTILVGIFLWQATTGVEIVQRILNDMAKAS
ncbi:MAG: DUF4079 domain-containing protein [Cyanobacteria bacterium M5B4]|nr:MAG: DUF4079 domain-containing protein [Cyanobacteria bacterium M5B4]